MIKLKVKKLISVIIMMALMCIPSHSFILQKTVYDFKNKVKSSNYSGRDINQQNISSELPTSIDYIKEEHWPYYYKNFIYNNGLVKFTFYDYNGNIVKQIKIMPADGEDILGPTMDEHKSNSVSRHALYHPAILGEKDLILSAGEISIPNKNNYYSSLNIPFFGDLNQITYNKDSIGDIDFGNEEDHQAIKDWGFKSDYQNINNLDYISNDNSNTSNYDFKYIYNTINYGSWTEAKNFKEWLTEENLKKLDEEINFGLTKDGAEVNVIDWLNQSSSEGIMNSIKVEPVSFYPNSTEEIMCSNNIISHAHNLTYGILRDTTEEQMKKIGLWGEGILGNKV